MLIVRGLQRPGIVLNVNVLHFLEALVSDSFCAPVWRVTPRRSSWHRAPRGRGSRWQFRGWYQSERSRPVVACTWQVRRIWRFWMLTRWPRWRLSRPVPVPQACRCSGRTTTCMSLITSRKAPRPRLMAGRTPSWLPFRWGLIRAAWMSTRPPAASTWPMITVTR